MSFVPPFPVYIFFLFYLKQAQGNILVYYSETEGGECLDIVIYGGHSISIWLFMEARIGHWQASSVTSPQLPLQAKPPSVKQLVVILISLVHAWKPLLTKTHVYDFPSLCWWCFSNTTPSRRPPGCYQLLPLCWETICVCIWGPARLLKYCVVIDIKMVFQHWGGSL